MGATLSFPICEVPLIRSPASVSLLGSSPGYAHLAVKETEARRGHAQGGRTRRPGQVRPGRWAKPWQPRVGTKPLPVSPHSGKPLAFLISGSTSLPATPGPGSLTTSPFHTHFPSLPPPPRLVALFLPLLFLPLLLLPSFSSLLSCPSFLFLSNFYQALPVVWKKRLRQQQQGLPRSHKLFPYPWPHCPSHSPSPPTLTLSISVSLSKPLPLSLVSRPPLPLSWPTCYLPRGVLR